MRIEAQLKNVFQEEAQGNQNIVQEALNTDFLTFLFLFLNLGPNNLESPSQTYENETENPLKGLIVSNSSEQLLTEQERNFENPLLKLIENQNSGLGEISLASESPEQGNTNEEEENSELQNVFANAEEIPAWIQSFFLNKIQPENSPEANSSKAELIKNIENHDTNPAFPNKIVSVPVSEGNKNLKQEHLSETEVILNQEENTSDRFQTFDKVLTGDKNLSELNTEKENIFASLTQENPEIEENADNYRSINVPQKDTEKVTLESKNTYSRAYHQQDIDFQSPTISEQKILSRVREEINRKVRGEINENNSETHIHLADLIEDHGAEVKWNFASSNEIPEEQITSKGNSKKSDFRIYHQGERREPEDRAQPVDKFSSQTILNRQEVADSRSTQNSSHQNLSLSFSPEEVPLFIKEMVVKLHPQGRHEAHLKLHPPELGELHLSVSVDRGEVKLLLTVEHPRAAEALNQHLGQLETAFEGLGLQFGGAEINLASGGGNSPGEQFAFSPSTVPIETNKNENDEEDRQIRQSNSLIDIRI